jgi:hypothetical protein
VNAEPAFLVHRRHRLEVLGGSQGRGDPQDQPTPGDILLAQSIQTGGESRQIVSPPPPREWSTTDVGNPDPDEGNPVAPDTGQSHEFGADIDSDVLHI